MLVAIVAGAFLAWKYVEEFLAVSFRYAFLARVGTSP
jgi:hypothetical protein